MLSGDGIDDIPEEDFKKMESDSFWCFSLMVDFIQDHYTFAQPGIQRMVHKLEEIIQKIDGNSKFTMITYQNCRTSVQTYTKKSTSIYSIRISLDELLIDA